MHHQSSPPLASSRGGRSATRSTPLLPEKARNKPDQTRAQLPKPLRSPTPRGRAPPQLRILTPTGAAAAPGPVSQRPARRRGEPGMRGLDRGHAAGLATGGYLRPTPGVARRYVEDQRPCDRYGSRRVDGCG
ncbi:hypothetical protein ZWY2020_002745 [Hordeum vulgare]|nr:hypothetical protein ZWY2020_002745 [Hordeum vulgare]